MRRTPALIVGGGPAGAAAAIGLARARLPHLLVERSRETGDAICGGFLSWRTLDSLRALGIEPDDLNRDRITRVRLYHGGRTREAALPRPAICVSRHRLDTLLLAQAERVGASVERGVPIRTIEVRAIEGRVARTADGATIAGDALFLANGKHDVRGLARPSDAHEQDPSLGIRVHLGPSPALSAIIGDAIELHLFDRGYAGLSLQEDGSANLCLAVHRSRLNEAGNPTALLASLAEESPRLRDRLAFLAPGAEIDAIANVPYGWRMRRGEAGLFRLGDQAGVIPSLAGEGMGIAIASGIAAANAYVRHGADGATQWQRGLARRIARPIAVADAVRRIGEGPLAPLMVAFARAPLVRLIAHTTRMPRAIP